MSNKIKRFTDEARDILALAQETAENWHSQQISSIHMFVGFSRAKNTLACQILADVDIVETKLVPFVKPKAIPKDNIQQTLELGDDVKRILELAVDTSRRRNHSRIGTVTLLIGMMRHEDNPKVDDILNHFDVQRKEIIKQADYYLEDRESHPESISVLIHPAHTHQKGCLDTLRSLLKF